MKSRRLTGLAVLMSVCLCSCEDTGTTITDDTGRSYKITFATAVDDDHLPIDSISSLSLGAMDGEYLWIVVEPDPPLEPGDSDEIRLLYSDGTDVAVFPPLPPVEEGDEYSWFVLRIDEDNMDSGTWTLKYYLNNNKAVDTSIWVSP